MKRSNKTLKVFAKGLVREVDPLTGQHLGGLRFVGKDANGVSTGAVEVPYHPVYVHHLMTGDLVPADAPTAALAGVSLPTESSN